MGLLSLLSRGLQQPFVPGQPLAAPAPIAPMMGAPQMGAAPPPAAEKQAMAMPQAQPQQGGGFLSRILGGASGQPVPQNGGVIAPTMMSHPLTFALGGQGALRGMQEMQLNQRNEQRAGEAFKMQGQQFRWQGQEQERAAQQRQAWEAAVARETDPQRQATLRAIGPAGYAEWMGGEQERSFNAQQNQTNRNFQAEQAELDRRNALNVAGMRLTGANRPEGASPYWQRPSGRDQMMLQDYEGAVQNSRVAIRGLDRLENLFGEMIGRDAQGRPLPAATRMSLSRLAQTNPEARAAYEQIQAQVWPLVLQALEGLAPVTEVELGEALARTINGDMTPAAVMAEIARLRQEAQYAQDLGLRAFEFVGEAGSLNTGRNSAGQNWIEYSGLDRVPGEPGDPGGGSPGRQPPQAPPAPQRGAVENGYRFLGGDPGDRSRWVRVIGGDRLTNRQPAQRSSQEGATRRVGRISQTYRNGRWVND